jgi:hypothetical protein
VLGVDLASSYLNSLDKAPGSRRRNENGKVERLGSRLLRRNDSSVKHNLAGLPPQHVFVAAEAIQGVIPKLTNADSSFPTSCRACTSKNANRIKHLDGPDKPGITSRIGRKQ